MDMVVTDYKNSRLVGSDDWELDRVMKLSTKEVQVRKRAAASSIMSQKKPARSQSTAATLLAGLVMSLTSWGSLFSRTEDSRLP